MDFNDPGLENDIVRLTKAGAEHKELLRASTIDSMWKWMPVLPSGTSFESYFSEIIALRDAGVLYPYLVTRVSDNRFAGLTAFVDLNKTHRRLRIGLSWHPEDMRGTHIFPATQLVMIKRAFDCRVRRIEWQLDERNGRAISALEKLGVTNEGTLRHYYRLAGGDWANVTVFSLLSEESAETIRRLENHLGLE